MKLFFSPNSPYVRKVLVSAYELGLDEQLTMSTKIVSLVEREQEVCLKVLAMREEGKSRYQIAIALLDGGVRRPRRKKGCGDYYLEKDICLMERAARVGFPRLPRDELLGPDYEQRLAEARSRGQPL